MALTSSYVVEHDQIDERFWVNEKHVDVTSKEHLRFYLADDATDKDAVLSLHAANLEASLQESEVKQAIEIDAAPIPIYQTGTQFLQRLREIYRASSKERCARIARWILRRLEAGHVTAAQLQNVFNLTAGQWNVLQAKLEVIADGLTAVEGAEGE